MKHIGSKFLLFLIIIICIENGISHFFPYPAPLAVTNLLLYQKKKVDIIFFGDSTLTWSGMFDQHPQATPFVLNTLLQNKYSVGMVEHDSYQANMYNGYTRFMSDEKYYPQYVIIPINLRSFSPEWDLRPVFQFSDESIYLQYINTPFSPFISFLINISTPDINRFYDKVFTYAPVHDGNKVVGNTSQFESKMRSSIQESVRFPAMLQMFYLGSISNNHRKLTDLTTIADRYVHTRTKVIFYITPIDYEIGEKYFGKHFTIQVDKNAQVIIHALQQHGATVVNLSHTLSTTFFIWHEVPYINEHVNQEGKYFIAAQLAKVIMAYSNKQ